jgi:hypothetical protein
MKLAQAHGTLVTENTLKGWLYCFKIEQRFVDVKDDRRKCTDRHAAPFSRPVSCMVGEHQRAAQELGRHYPRRNPHRNWLPKSALTGSDG